MSEGLRTGHEKLGGLGFPLCSKQSTAGKHKLLLSFWLAY
jgi:hypothetical protein